MAFPPSRPRPTGSTVTIEFYDKRNDPGENVFVDLYLAESFDGGDTWEPNLRLSEFSSDIRNAPMESGFDQHFLGDYQGIVPSLNFQTPAVAAWIDTRAGNSDPYVVRIWRTKGTTFDTWRKLRFSTNDLANAAISSENADPDGDGIPNLVEYAFGLEPTQSNSSPFQITIGHSSSVPQVAVSSERLAVLGDIHFSWQESINLVEWTPITPEQETISAGRNPSMQRVDVSFSGSDQVKFFRQNVQRVSPTR